jgi:hypothetical protein
MMRIQVLINLSIINKQEANCKVSRGYKIMDKLCLFLTSISSKSLNEHLPPLKKNKNEFSKVECQLNKLYF